MASKHDGPVEQDRLVFKQVTVELEQLESNHWWLKVTAPSGAVTHLNFKSPKAVTLIRGRDPEG